MYDFTVCNTVLYDFTVCNTVCLIVHIEPLEPIVLKEIKGIVHLKIKNLSVITYPHVVPIL